MANGDYNTQWGCRKNIFGQEIFDNSFSCQATKWFLHQNGVEFNQKSKSELISWSLVGL